MSFIMSGSPHIRAPGSVRALMLEVSAVLLPAIIAHAYFFGPGIIFNIFIATAFAALTEYLVLKLRKKPIALFLGDGSALLTAILIAFALPSLTPWWVTATASVFAIAVAKHAYGGLGYNTFNPAMAGYAVVLISFPTELALWPAAQSDPSLTFFEQLGVTLTGSLPAAMQWDQITQATPLDQVQIALNQGAMLSELYLEPTLNRFGNTPWIVINLAILAGGVTLLVRKRITWHIPLGVILSAAVLTLFLRLSDSDGFSPVFFTLLSGNLMLGAFFIATDPVSAAASRRGQVIYAIGIGVLIVTIRVWGSYPDGVAFAVLFMNMLVPLIDYATVPRAYGK